MCGANELGGRIDKMCKYVPDKVNVRIPEIIAPNASFVIDSDHGRDQSPVPCGGRDGADMKPW